MASKSLGTLTLDLIAKVGGFTAGLDQAERSSAKFRRQVERNIKGAISSLAVLGIATAAATAALIKSSISNAAALYDQSQAYGVAVEDLSTYAHGAEMADVSSEQLATGLGKLSRAIESDSDALKKLGVNSRDSNGHLRSVRDVIEDVADRFAGMEDGAAKTALAQDLLGRAGARMIPFLNGGRDGLAEMREEAERLGLVISGDTAAAADAFEDNLVKVKGVIRGTGNELAQALLPQLVEFTDTINDPETQQALKDLIKGMAELAIMAVKLGTAAVGAARFIADSFGADFDDYRGLQEQLHGINRQIDRLNEPRRGTLNIHDQKRLVDLNAERLELLAKISAEEERLAGILPRTLESPSSGAAGGTGGDPLSGEELTDQEKLNELFKERLAQYQQQATLGANASELRRVQYEMEQGALRGLNEEQRAQLELWAQAVSTQPLEAAMEAQQESGKQMEADLRKQLALIGDNTEAAKLRYELEQEAFAYLDPAQKLRIVMLAEELDAQRAIIEEEKAANEEREKQGKALQELGLEAARNIQGHFADFLFDPFDDGLKGMLKGMGQTVRRMSAEIASSAMLKSVFGFLGKSSNPYLAAIGGAFAGKFDGGGSIGAGQWGIVGEIGPEIVRGPAMVTSREQTAGMLSGAGNIQVIVNSNGTGVQHRVRQFDGGRGGKQIVIDAMRDAAADGQLDDVFAQFGMTRSRGITT